MLLPVKGVRLKDFPFRTLIQYKDTCRPTSDEMCTISLGAGKWIEIYVIAGLVAIRTHSIVSAMGKDFHSLLELG